SIVVMAAYLLLTFGAMVVVPQKDANSTYAILQAVQTSLGAGVAAVVTLIMIFFFIFNTTVYNYSFARLLFVSGLDPSLAGAIASAVGVYVTLTGSWNSSLIANGPWLVIVGGTALASLAVAVIVYLLGLNTARRAQAAAGAGAGAGS